MQKDRKCHKLWTSFQGSTTLLGSGLLYLFSRSHSDTPQSVEGLWTSDRPVAETSIWQVTTLATHRTACPRRDSNPQSQKTSGHRPKPYIARQPRSASYELLKASFFFLNCSLFKTIKTDRFVMARAWSFNVSRLLYLPPGLTFKTSTWYSDCVYVFSTDRTTNSDFCFAQH